MFYMYTRFEQLSGYVNDAQFGIDNNPVERSIRPLKMCIIDRDMAKGGVVYENDIPEVQSAYITISIANFPAEEYKLEITGTPSGHLTGYFTKE